MNRTTDNPLHLRHQKAPVKRHLIHHPKVEKGTAETSPKVTVKKFKALWSAFVKHG
jgi:hypothetical protein